MHPMCEARSIPEGHVVHRMIPSPRNHAIGIIAASLGACNTASSRTLHIGVIETPRIGLCDGVQELDILCVRNLVLGNSILIRHRPCELRRGIDIAWVTDGHPFDGRNWAGGGRRSVSNMFIDLGYSVQLTEDQFQAEMATRRGRCSLSMESSVVLIDLSAR